MRSSLLILLLIISVCFTHARPVCKDTTQCANVQRSTSDGDVSKLSGVTTIGLRVPHVTTVKLFSQNEQEPATDHFLDRIWTIQGVHRLRYMFHVILAIFLFCLAMMLIVSLIQTCVQERRSERRSLRPKGTPVLIKPMPDMNKRYLVAV